MRERSELLTAQPRLAASPYEGTGLAVSLALAMGTVAQFNSEANSPAFFLGVALRGAHASRVHTPRAAVSRPRARPIACVGVRGTVVLRGVELLAHVALYVCRLVLGPAARPLRARGPFA
jgi:hypothetical protein